MKPYDQMILQIAPRAKVPFLLTKGKIIKAAETWIASLSEEEKDRQIIRLDGKPPVRVRDIPKTLAEDKDFRRFWIKKSVAYYNQFLRRKA